MAAVELSGKAVKIGVLVFSLAGVLGLTVIANMTGIEEVPLSELAQNEGRTVRVKARVVGCERTSIGGARLLLHQENSFLEVYIERSEGGISPGLRISVSGEVGKDNGVIVLTAQSDKALEVLGSEELPVYSGGWENWTMCMVQGTISSISGRDYAEMEAVLRPLNTSVGPARNIRLEVQDIDIDLMGGDTIEAKALMMENGTLRCFGDGCVRLVSSALPRTASLLELVNEIEGSPSTPPLEPLVVEGYLRYEPAGRTFYIGDSADSPAISIKASSPTGCPELHRGDLVRLLNCSLVWEASDMRYMLSPASLQLLEAHGPFLINLGSVEGGLAAYEGSVVILEGALINDGGRKYMVDRTCRVEVRGINGPFTEGISSLEGRVVYDPLENVVYLKVESA